MGLTEQHLDQGARIKYVGKTYDFIPPEQEVTFLGYDSNSWYHIWVAYGDTKLYITVHDVDLIL